MRLFGKVDGAINRYDRAAWLTVPFDLALTAPVQEEPACLSVGDEPVTRCFVGDEAVTRVFTGDEVCR